jgi:predicted KAP-like P-loop ATPase
MESMQAALKKVSKLPAHQIDDDVMIWARDLKELSYDIEDSVDTFMVRVDASVCAKTHSFSSFFDRTIGLLTKAKIRRRIVTDIEEIKSRIHVAADRRARYTFEDVAQPDRTVVDSRLPALYEDVKNLIGIDGSAEKLTTLLMREQGEQLMVVSIAGVAGLGKTALANLVFRRLRGEFQSQAFVSVSLKPDLKKILSSILRQVSGMEYKYINAEVWSHAELIDNIRQILEGSILRQVSGMEYKYINAEVWSHAALIDNIRQILEDARYILYSSLCI